MNSVILLLCCLCLNGQLLVWAKTFDKCSLTRELQRLNVPHNELADWVCVAQHESSFNTKAMNTNSNKSKDWGLFQINDRYWCKPDDNRKSKNVCKVDCKDLLQDNITKAVHCAQIIKREHKGFTAWAAWNKHCQNSKPDISQC